MNLDLTQFSLPALLISTLVSLAIMGLWYSPVLFGKDLKSSDPTMKMSERLLLNLVFSFAAATLLQILIAITELFGIFSCAEMGFLFSLGLIAPSVASDMTLQNKNRKQVFITALRHVISFTAMGAIIGGFR